MMKTITFAVYDRVTVDLSRNEVVLNNVDESQIIEDMGAEPLLDAMEYEDIIKWVSAREEERKEDAGY